jgi:hypothetical protein
MILMKTNEELSATPAMTNSFFIKAMEVNTATMNIKEFTYAILCGYMERMFLPQGNTKVQELNKYMEYRKIRAKLGKGPA